jgi:hypothetical protein
MPGIFIAACWWAASKLLKKEFLSLAPVVGVIGGQLATLVVTALSLGWSNKRRAGA